MNRRSSLAGIAALTALSAFRTTPSSAGDADYPTRPVRFVVPFPPGGGTDVLARLLAEPLAARLGKPVVVENRGGANGNVGMAAAASAPPDGHTIVLAAVGTWAVNPHLYPRTFDVIKDFAPIMHVTSSPGILAVHPSLPVRSVAELIALGKAEPQRLNYGSAGIGGFGHISGAMFALMTGTPMTHVPYRGAGPAQAAAIAGEVQVIFNDALSTLPLLRDGLLRAIGVTTLERVPLLPEVPTIDEAGVSGYENASWMGLAASGGTPATITGRLSREMTEVLQMPAIRERIDATGARIIASTPEQFAALLRRDIAKFERVVREAGITAQ